MEGKIDKNGAPWIKRANSFVMASCPFVVHRGDSLTDGPAFKSVYMQKPCGDGCPHFGEPVNITTKIPYTDGERGYVELKLCHGKTLSFDTFKDERK